MGGRACIRGMRIPVSVIVGQIAHGATFEEILDGYADLEREGIQQAIEYAASERPMQARRVFTCFVRGIDTHCPRDGTTLGREKQTFRKLERLHHSKHNKLRRFE